MRIRGTSVEELEEAGLATDGLIESTAKLQSQIKALSGVDIMIDSETYKSTYQIMLEIAKVWDNISDINQAALLEALAGKRNSQVLMSVIQNLDDLTGSYEAAQNAAGAMEEANAIAMDTITGKTKALSASWQELSGNLLDSELIKGFMDLAMLVVNGFNDINQATGGVIVQITALVALFTVLKVAIGTMQASALAGGFGALKKSITGIASALALFFGQWKTAGIRNAASGMLSLATPATKATLAITALVAVGYGAYKIYKKFNPTLEELATKAKEASGEVEELSSAISENNKRIYELQELSRTGKITSIEAEELEQLKEENRLLGLQLQLKHDLADIASKEAADKAHAEVSAFFDGGGSVTHTSREDGSEYNFHFRSGADLFTEDLEEYKRLKAEYEQALRDGDEDAADDLAKRMSKASGAIQATMEQMEAWISNLDLNNPEDLAFFEQLQEQADKVRLLMGGSGAIKPLFTDIIARDKWADAVTALQEVGKEGELTAGKLSALRESNPLIDEFVQYLIRIGMIDPSNFANFVNQFNRLQASLTGSAKETPIATMVESVKGPLDTLRSGMEEMAETGVISLETLKDVSSNSDLKKYLVQTANGYKLTTGAVEDFTNAQLKQYDIALTKAKQAAAAIINQQANIKMSVGDTTDAYVTQIETLIAAESAALLLAQSSAASVLRTSGAGDSAFYAGGNFDVLSPSAIEAKKNLSELRAILNDLKVAQTDRDNIESVLRAPSKPSSKSDPYKERIEKEIKIYQHKREMDVITDEEYYDFLKLKLAEYEKYATKYEEEIWDLKQEIFNGQREMLDDWVNDQQKAAERVAMTGNIEGQLDIHRSVIDRMKKELDEAYAYGLDANSDYVQNLEAKIRDAAKSILDITKSVFDDFISYADDFNRWDNIGEDLDISKVEMLRAKLKSIQKLLDDGTISWEDYLDAYNEAAKSLYDTQKESIETIIDLTMELIEQEAEDEIEALEKQADAYDELIEKKKELLEKADDEADHEKKVAEAVREIAKLQSKISQLSLDDSREAAAQKAKLEEELYQKQLELADLQGDYALEQTLETLDKAQEANKETVDAEKEAIEKSIDTWVKKYEQAIDRIDNDWDGLYKDLLDYQEEYRDSIDGIDSFETAWRNVEDTIIDVNENIADSISSTIKGIEDIYQAIENVGVNPGTPNLDDDGAWDGTVSGGASSATSSKYSSLVSEKGRSIVQKMYNNSVKAASNPSLRDTLNQQNHDLAADYYWQTGDELYYNAPSGTWHIGDSYSDPFLYEVYGLKKYHTGGYVGNEGAINDREVLSVLEKGELVLTKGHQFNLKKILSDMYAMVKAMTSINLPSFSTSATSPNGNFNANVEVNITHNGSMTDDDAKRYGSIAGDAALKKLYAAFNKRGIR